jgi:CRISPR-associated endonuclease/helicase Cas3
MKFNTIEENEIFKLINYYFKTAKTRISETKSQQYLNAINEMYFDGEKQTEKIPISEFKLIEEDYEKVSVFIEVDEKAKDKWEKYSAVLLEENRIERKKRFNAIKAEFYEYVINIPRKGNLPAEVNSIYYVSNSDLKNYYDKILDLFANLKYETDFFSFIIRQGLNYCSKCFFPQCYPARD